VVHQELRRPGVTLQLLWEEYQAAHPQGFGYSWFCAHYRAWADKLDLVMRQTHRAGETLFVDYAGQTARKNGAE
jgi:transposase